MNAIAILLCLLALAGAFASLVNAGCPSRDAVFCQSRDEAMFTRGDSPSPLNTTKAEWVPPQERWMRLKTDYHKRRRDGVLVSASMGTPTALVEPKDRG